MASKPLALILGGGPRVGASVAESFASNGYDVAIASRSGRESKSIPNSKYFKTDFNEADSVPKLFDAVKGAFGVCPNVVVYNAAAFTGPPDKDSMFSISADSVVSDLNVNTISAYKAAQHAMLGWKTLPEDTNKTFIYTGNSMNVSVVPMAAMVNLGMGKSASAYWIGVADLLYSAGGTRFFYADERHEDGKQKGMELDGAAHGEFYVQLASHAGHVPWHATFVKGKGYVQFER